MSIDTSAVEAFVQHQLAARGTPDGLVVMTYASTAKTLDELTAEDFDQANHGNLDVHTGAFSRGRKCHGKAWQRQPSAILQHVWQRLHGPAHRMKRR